MIENGIFQNSKEKEERTLWRFETDFFIEGCEKRLRCPEKGHETSLNIMVLHKFRTFYPSRTFLLHFFVLNIRNKQEFRGLLPGFQVMLRSAIKSDIFISGFKLCKMENKLKIKIQLFKQQRKITICFLVFKRTPHSPYTT